MKCLFNHAEQMSSLANINSGSYVSFLLLIVSLLGIKTQAIIFRLVRLVILI